jgi:hypothetical protein
MRRIGFVVAYVGFTKALPSDEVILVSLLPATAARSHAKNREPCRLRLTPGPGKLKAGFQNKVASAVLARHH